MTLGEGIGVALIWVGIFFSVVGVLGIMRMPDVYCRLHSSGKVSTVGIAGLLAGGAVLLPEITLKAVALALFLVITAPVASHAIAAAAYRQGVPRANCVRDDLAALEAPVDITADQRGI